MRACLKASSIFLIPSLWENCPYSCLEAMTAGRAIVSSDCGGMPELIEHERTGLLAKNGDPAAFVAALQRMIEDDGLRARCGAAARAEVEKRLTDVAIARRSVEVYQSFLDGGPTAMAVPAASGRDVGDLRRRLAGAEAELSKLRLREAELRAGRSWAGALKQVLGFGPRHG